MTHTQLGERADATGTARTYMYVLVYTSFALREARCADSVRTTRSIERPLYGACGLIERDRQYALCTVHAKCTTFNLVDPFLQRLQDILDVLKRLSERSHNICRTLNKF